MNGEDGLNLVRRIIMLKIEHLSKTFGKKQILKDATFTFQEGGIYSLLGGNGSGRTVLLQCIANELSYDGGTITVDGGWRAFSGFQAFNMASISDGLPADQNNFQT